MTPDDNRFPTWQSGRSPRADARRESIDNATAGRRLIKEAERNEAIAEGKPVPRGRLSRALATLLHRDA